MASSRTAKITIWKKRPSDVPGAPKRRPEWRWTRVAANQLVIGASTQGYDSRRDATKNLETISGGKVELTVKHRVPKGEFCQGYLERFGPADQAGSERIFVEVLP